ncbi:MAG: glycerol-3-phosphate O-acyltransferase [Solirubrobacteraceae bacterium]|jgi:glycerol-3-phosphate O-acyltransferase|nr:glycerol-3-phosphate O-acyltransferase [Solirubrobacteraceae bacterium]
MERTEQAKLNGSPNGNRATLVLADMRTTVEEELVERWVREHHPGAPIMRLSDEALDARLAEGDDPLVVPVRPTWLPPPRDDERSKSGLDLFLLTDPRKPWSRFQQRFVARDPERVSMSEGEPASLSDLRAAFRKESGGGGGHEAFTAFVSRRAMVAIDRAERLVTGDRYKVPRMVAEQITASKQFREKLAKIAEKEDRPFDDALQYAEECLAELASVQSPIAIDIWRALFRPLHQRAWELEVDTDSLERLREVNKKHALVFLPTHRSYMDPIVMAEVLHQQDFPRNHLLGGNNMGFWPIGPLGKRAGVIFIRRSFGGDAIYKLAVRELLGHLVSKRFNLEWYFEGGRTRTGKLRPPKLGLLYYLASAINEGRAEDVMLCPVSIVYDRQQEVSKMAAEHAGAVKKGEGLGWLAGYFRAQRERVGSARVAFGDPFSLKDSLAEAGDGPAQLEKVAFRIADGINQVTPATANSLVTLALLGSRDRALTVEQVHRLTTPLIDYLRARKIPGPYEELDRPSRLRKRLHELVDAGVASSFAGGDDEVFSIAADGHVVAAYYRNAALHHFVNRAIIELALLKEYPADGEGDSLDIAFEETLKLRDQLKYEFFFAEKERFRKELNDELRVIDPDYLEHVGSPDAAADLLSRTGALVAHRALRSFVDAQLVVSERLLKRNPRQAVDEKEFLDECMGAGRQMLLQGRLQAPEAVSRELFASALKLAGNRDILDPGREVVKEGRRAWYDEICDVVVRLEHVRKLDDQLLERVLDE